MRLFRISEALTLLVVVIISSSKAETYCYHHLSPLHRLDGLLSPWRDSPFHNLMSVFEGDEPWFHHHLHQVPHSLLQEERARLYHHPQHSVQQQESDEGELTTLAEQREDRCRRWREAAEEKRVALEKQQRLAELEKEEQLLLDEQQQRVEQFKQQQQDYVRRRDEIQKLKRQESKRFEPLESSAQVQQNRDTELEDMKLRHQRMIKEQLQQQQQQLKEESESYRDQQKRQEVIDKARRQAALEQQLAKQQRAEQQKVEWQRMEKQRQQEAEQLQRQAAIKEQAAIRNQNRQTQQAEICRIPLVRHQIDGYDPDEITITVADKRIRLDGKHICHCDQNCITTEFTRVFPITRDIAYDTIRASMNMERVIVVEAAPTNRTSDQEPSEQLTVQVEGIDIPQSTRPTVEELMQCSKGGIKLNKINKRTGRQHTEEQFKFADDINRERGRKKDQWVDNSNLEDDSFVEVEDYY